MFGRMKIGFRIYSRLGIIIASTFIFSFSGNSKVLAASYEKYVKKYNGVEISEVAVTKLDKYDDYIHYFTNFSFFKPRHKVSPNFLKALILAESSANPQALSSKNARGLTQILPETGKQAAKELYDRKMEFAYVPRKILQNLQPDDLYDPAINILLASYLISKYNHEYNGQLELVVSAWNAGRNSITEKREPPDYQETLNLIGKINGYFIYLLDKGKQYGPGLADQ